MTTFKMTGILQGPLMPENLWLDVVKFEFIRPTHDTHLDKKLSADYADAYISINFASIIGVYQENNTAYDGNDLITMRVKIDATATNQNIYIKNLYVAFDKDCSNSIVTWLDTYFKFENLSLVSHSCGWSFNDSYKRAYARLEGINYPREISFSATLVWSFNTSNDKTHHTQLTCEITYYNGTVYKKIIQPFELTIIGE